MSELSPLVNENDEIKIKVTFCKLKDGSKVAFESKEELEKIYQDSIDLSSVKEYEMTFKQPNFGESVDMAKDFLSTYNGQEFKLNPLSLRARKMQKLIKRWNLDVPPTEENVSKLHPVIANYVGMILDTQTTNI